LAGPAIDDKHLILDLTINKMENGPELMDIPAPNNVDSTTNEMMEDEHIVSCDIID
jgi:hypothetical protein